MSAAAPKLLERLRDRGVQFVPARDRIRYRPKDALTAEECDALAKNKGAILAALYREQAELMFCTGVPPDDAELAEIARRVEGEGYILLWSTVLQDLVAFSNSEADADRAPQGVVTYTVGELALLFGDTASAPSPDAMHLIHHAKKLGGGRVLGNDPAGTQLGESRP